MAMASNCPSPCNTWCSLMAKPTMNRTSISAITTAVKICIPTGSFRRSSSISTLATMPRLDRDSTPATAMASVKVSSSPTSKMTLVVTASEATMEMATDSTAAIKRRPRIARTNPEMSSSSRPTRKKKMKMPMLRMIWKSFSASINPVTGPRITPVMA